MPPKRRQQIFDPNATRTAPLPASARETAWSRARDFCALGGEATLLWPRWLVLRAVGLVYVFVFAGIIAESRALIGSAGIVPLSAYLDGVKKIHPGAFESLLAAPSLFWLGRSDGLIAALGWLGLAAAVAVVLNLWPRLALGTCWIVFLSFVTTWADFSPAQLDGLMLEVALLCIPFAPAGLRPGLGANTPPRPIAIFMMRWMLLRVMFESALVKLVSLDPHWRNLTAMDALYETAPSPTILGYWVHQLPHAYHVFEIAFTFAAEFVAPLLAIFGGRRGRWIALALWTTLQLGIQLTCNFGWLNTAAIGLGLLLLDDHMIASAVAHLRIGAVRGWFAAPTTTSAAPAKPAWRLYGMRAAFAVHFALTLFYFAQVCHVPLAATTPAPVKFFEEFRSANGYSLYANFDHAHYQVDFEGSNDAGKTWRTYEMRNLPQRVDRVSPFLSPWFARFETTLNLKSRNPEKAVVVSLVASHLLVGNPAVLERFARNPFPDRPPTVVRMRRYRLTFTDLATQRRIGNYWRKEFAGEFLPALYKTAAGGIARFDLAAADAAVAAGNATAALRLYDAQFQLGNLDAGYRIADLLSGAAGGRPQLERVYALFADLAARGEVRALHNLGMCHELGIGVSIDIAQAADCYRRAADRGNLRSRLALGKLAAEDRLMPRAEVEGLASLLCVAQRAEVEEPLLSQVRAEEPALAQRLAARMSPGDIAQAQALAFQWR